MLAMPIIREANIPLTVLTTTETFVVTSLRLWFLGAVNPNAAICDWRDGFVQARLDDEAVPAFHTLLRILGSYNRHALDIRWPCCSRLGADEAAFLHYLGLMQQERLVEAYAFLRGWIRPCVPAIAIEQSEKFVAFLTQAGLLFPNKQSVDLSPQNHEDFRLRRASRLLH